MTTVLVCTNVLSISRKTSKVGPNCQYSTKWKKKINN